MRVAVSGASGFVGAAVVDRLLDRGHEVLALSRRPVQARPGLVHRAWDLTTGVLPDPSPVDVVVHAAAHVDEWAPREVHDAVTVGGTRAVLATWPRARVVLVSSCSVYPLRAPAGSGHVFTEDVPVTTRHLSSYSRAKAEQERLVLGRAGSVVLRPHAVHGPGDPTLLPRLERARRHGRLLCPGGADTLVHLTDVRLVAEAAVASSEFECDTTVLNIADAHALPLSVVAAGVAAANGWPERPLFTGAGIAWAAALALEATARLTRASTPPLLTAYAVSHLAVSRVFDTTRLRQRLGVEPGPTDLSRWRHEGTGHGDGDSYD
ncbi:NAD(P)-dependent oxidoreductase [Terracoccus sp. 273MFTsu3.1]|uniref:NAD-dependent epimerase/dehydratase family protein n=1 Tax=Terracoccus sp. 273MFTsu3.1 TaxID=1172188 RepID=UPI00037DFA2D|nr:NAD(P)-dependent oxidoreductase [Terracoccus sp. 273MFTsu3.1]